MIKIALRGFCRSAGKAGMREARQCGFIDLVHDKGQEGRTTRQDQRNMWKAIGGGEERGQPSGPSGNATALVDRVDHDERARASSLAGGIEGPENRVWSSVSESELVANLTPGFTINETCAKEENGRKAMGNLMVGHISQQMGFAYTRFTGDEEAMRICQPAFRRIDRFGESVERPI
ncbi:hypothetical protein DWF00_04195 [Bosea caraganae]|uniref:Uncharacterized protein n=1 Tax=Bosea caraganae TaxID=2763117 RepID=A0A370KXF1_9HYPH|nr:hypothetical protein DWE98_28670 [Bosea caraganae]RDJ30068.1 hypothetical protein DWF00_04195 [Bosea caraganae]